jgi:xanthine dehydrogenase accessory factor
MNLYKVITEYLEQGKGGMLATVIKRAGSAPRDVGAKMFIGEDGKTFGTVGGGQLESDSYNKGLEIMNKGLTETFGISMDAQSIEERDMLCGGNVEVLLEPVTIEHLNIYQQIENCIVNREKGIVATRFGNGIFSKTLIDKHLNTTGDTLDTKTINHCKDIFREKKSMLLDGIFFDPIKLSFPLYLFGAGHVSRCLSKIAKGVDFHITVIDDREKFANKERFPDADNIIVADFHDAFNLLDFTGNEYVVILTRNHTYDASVLEEAMKKPVKYVGMIGSKRKVSIIFDHMRKKGKVNIVSDDMREKGIDNNTIKKIHAPIGISINAETPEEIAVSIVAEIIKVRAKVQ